MRCEGDASYKRTATPPAEWATTDRILHAHRGIKFDPISLLRPLHLAVEMGREGGSAET
jgi:hypothetical protein